MPGLTAAFDAQLDAELEDILNGDFLALKNGLAEDMLVGVTDKMPVKTGAAKGNTIVSVGQPDLSWDASKTDKDGGSTIAEGKAVLAANKDPFAVVYVQHNGPYINRLEGGYSQQAPLGMFALTLAEIGITEL